MLCCCILDKLLKNIHSYILHHATFSDLSKKTFAYRFIGNVWGFMFDINNVSSLDSTYRTAKYLVLSIIPVRQAGVRSCVIFVCLFVCLFGWLVG